MHVDAQPVSCPDDSPGLHSTPNDLFSEQFYNLCHTFAIF